MTTKSYTAKIRLFLAFVYEDRRFREALVRQLSAGKLLYAYVNHSADIRDLALSPNGKYVASASNDTTVHIWQTDTGKHVYTYSNHKDQVASVMWSPDGTRIASGCKDGTVHVWQAT